MTLVAVQGLTKTYTSGEATVHALRGVDLTVDHGDFVAITGPSGAGKSTLLGILGALDSPTSGDVLIEGRSLSNAKPRELAAIRNKRIGFVFQFFNLLPSLSVEENILLPATIAGVRPRASSARFDELVSAFGLGPLTRRFPTALSGGEQQRVAMARALILSPPLLLADEPTGNLDSTSAGEILDLLARIRAEGQTIVLVTHDLRTAMKAGRVVVLRDGVIVDDLDTSPATDGAVTLGRIVRVMGDSDDGGDP